MTKRGRREFLKQAALAGGALSAGLSTSSCGFGEIDPVLERSMLSERCRQDFNMCGYAAPKLPVVRIGIVGLGRRGLAAVKRLSYLDQIEIVALCDKYPERVAESQAILEGMTRPRAAEEYSGEEGWKGLCESTAVDLVYTPTPWSLHTPVAVRAMGNGKHAALEVPAATTLDDCWLLVETSERTRRHCMMLENCCYDFFELLTLNVVRKGLFGELVHAEGAYIHDLARQLFDRGRYADMWRLNENASRNGNLYPTHGLGPIAQCLNINRGDRLESLVSMSSIDFTLNDLAKEAARDDQFFESYIDRPYRGNMNTSIIRTARGKTMLVKHDVSSPNPYSRLHVLNGTKGSARKYPLPEQISFGDTWIGKDELAELSRRHEPAIVTHIGKIAAEIGGHGGMDFMMDWRLIDCLRNGLPLDQDVYDAALWSSIGPLSELASKRRTSHADVPDFTRGAWRVNRPVDLTLDGGATTTVRSRTGDGAAGLDQ
jgi:predicted dehydrogenase